MTRWTRHVTLTGVIPDIAFMVALYGAARLIVSLLDPYRRGTGTGAQIAAAVTWVVGVGTIVGLVFLAAEVASSANTLGNLGG